MKKNSLHEIVRNKTCIGCGYCASFNNGSMIKDNSGFLIPDSKALDSLKPQELKKVLGACPSINGNNVSAINDNRKKSINRDYMWGDYLYIGTAFSTDKDIRYTGSSGGVITAICSWLAETNQVDAVLNTFYSSQEPIETQSLITSDLSIIKSSSGSKYSPSSPLSILNEIRGTKGKYAVVGRPCDISTLRRAVETQGDFHDISFIYISFFCAGTPSLTANEKLLKEIGVKEKASVKSFRHRGNGWPGYTTATLQDGTTKRCTYNESWGGILRSYTNDLCKICPDGIGEQADIVAADAWFGDGDGYPDFNEKDGRSLIMARTELGMEIITSSINEHVIESNVSNIRDIDKMQPGQLNRRKQLRMRVLAFKILLRIVPKYKISAIKQYEANSSLFHKTKVLLKTIKKLW